MLYLPQQFKLAATSTSTGKGSSHLSPSSGFPLLLHIWSLSLHLYKQLGDCAVNQSKALIGEKQF